MPSRAASSAWLGLFQKTIQIFRVLPPEPPVDLLFCRQSGAIPVTRQQIIPREQPAHIGML